MINVEDYGHFTGIQHETVIHHNGPHYYGGNKEHKQLYSQAYPVLEGRRNYIRKPLYHIIDN